MSRTPLPGLLCLHGWGLNGSVWRPLADRLDGRARLLAPDLPGHGRRAAEARLGTVEDAADRMAGLVEDGPMILVGWSLGGLVALAMAQRHLHQVARVVLLAATPRFVRASDWPHAMDPGVLDAFAEDLVGDYRATLTRFLALQCHGIPDRSRTLRSLRAHCLDAPPHPAALAQGLEMLRHTDLRALLGTLEVPVSAVLGARDTLVPAELSEDLARLRPGMSVHVVEGSGHAPLLSHPDVVADLIMETDIG